MLKNLRCQRNDLHVNGTKLTGYGAEDTAATELTGVVQKYTGIVVEADVRTIGTTDLLLCADDQSLRYCTLLYVTRRDCVFDSNDNHVTYAGITAAGTTQDTDAKSLACAAVISYCKP